MPEFNTKRWTKKHRISSNRRDFGMLQHVTHIPVAAEIIRDREIKADLIFDESRLNTERTCVVWLSPNDWWVNGYRYGSIAFRFNWIKLIRKKNFFWVGEMLNYRPPACRILITEKDRPDLTKYDPVTGDGPWVRDKKTKAHSWNGNYTMEFMLEGPLGLDDVVSIEGVKHHPAFCNIDHHSCTEKGTTGWDAQKLLMADLIARQITVPEHLTKKNDGTMTAFASNSWSALREHIVNAPYKLGSIPSDTEPLVVRAAFANIANNKNRRRLLGLLPNKKRGLQIAKKLFSEASGIDESKLK